jgi:uncharacterized protein
MVIESPCIKLCVLDPVSGLCTGCGRTLDEIAQWASLTQSERRRVVDALPARLAQNTPVAAAST